MILFSLEENPMAMLPDDKLTEGVAGIIDFLLVEYG